MRTYGAPRIPLTKLKCQVVDSSGYIGFVTESVLPSTLVPMYPLVPYTLRYARRGPRLLGAVDPSLKPVIATPSGTL